MSRSASHQHLLLRDLRVSVFFLLVHPTALARPRRLLPPSASFYERGMRGSAVICGSIAALLLAAAPCRAEAPLRLDARIDLPGIIGRLDHLAADVARRRIFVAEPGNDSVGVVDLAQQKVVRLLPHLQEPRGLGYVPASDTLYVSSGLDGALRLFHAETLAPAETIALGPEPDEIAVDAAARLVYVGRGAGAVSVIDDRTRKRRADIRLREHPQGMALAGDGKRLLVNVAAAHQLVVIDRAADKVAATLLLRDGRDNGPLALDGERIVTFFRRPPQLAVIAPKDGSALATLPTCMDAGDAFADAARHRLYLVCGEGVVEVLERSGEGYRSLARLPTGAGARTGLFLPELDRLIVAVPSAPAATPAPAGAQPPPPAPAALLLFRPTP